MTSRKELTEAFVARVGWGTAHVAPLAGDASNRRYLRLTDADGRHAVLMDAPPAKDEDIRPFLDIARRLSAFGLSAPEIYAEDAENGFLLIEDFGDALFARILEETPDMETELYGAAVDVLIHLQGHPVPTLQPYASEVTAPLAALSYDWYLAGTGVEDITHAKSLFLDAFTPNLARFDSELDALIQRDYHAENLIWLPERGGVRRVGLLDFQDAMRGHATYDLVSVLQDARRDVSMEVEAAMKSRYLRATRCDPTAFDTAYAVFGLQRNLRILGVFARLCLRDNKAHYVDLLPRVWRHIQTNLQHPSLADVAGTIATDLPAPGPGVLARLKENRGTWAGR